MRGNGLPGLVSPRFPLGGKSFFQTVAWHDHKGKSFDSASPASPYWFCDLWDKQGEGLETLPFRKDPKSVTSRFQGVSVTKRRGKVPR